MTPYYRLKPRIISKFPSKIAFTSAIVILCTLLFYGCLPSKQPPITIDYYTLDYEPPPANEAPVIPVIIAVDRFSSSPEYQTDKMLYQEKKATISAYTYHRWRTTPADIVSYYLARDLQASKLFLAVTSPSGRLRPTHRLEGVVDKFIESDEEPYWYAVISVTITVVKEAEPDVTKQVLTQQSFSSKIRCQEKSPLAVSQAMALAMAEITHDITILLAKKLR
nr:membrane integrity-associated transporter subunit PqiC [Desulfobulbaceae bacterium]